MAPKKRKRRNKFTEAPVPVDCIFCNSNKEPDYKKYDELKVYISDRAKIVGKKRSGICSKHQRRLTIQIKRARHLGLLPFTPLHIET